MVQSSVRRRGRRNSHGQDSSYFMGWEEYKKNPYSPIKNPHGIIQMGLAENRLSFDLLETWLADNPGAAGFDVNGGSVFRELALFQDYNGLPAFKKLWKRLLYDLKLNVSPGSSCHCEEPGWFRVCFANMEEETLILAMERMQDFVQSCQVDDGGGSDSRRITKSSGRFLTTRWTVLKFLSKNRDFTEYKLPEKEHDFFHKSYTGLKSVVFSG